MQRLEAAVGVHVDDHGVVELEQEAHGLAELGQPILDGIRIGEVRHKRLAVDGQADVGEALGSEPRQQFYIGPLRLIAVEPPREIESAR